MNIVESLSENHDHIQTTAQDGITFHKDAVEIAVLDRWGKPVWKKEKEKSVEPLRWDGLDSFGIPVRGGSYLCKIVYPNNFVVYVPFVFIQK